MTMVCLFMKSENQKRAENIEASIFGKSSSPDIHYTRQSGPTAHSPLRKFMYIPEETVWLIG